MARATAGALRRVAELLAAAVCREGELWLAGERLRIGRLKSDPGYLSISEDVRTLLDSLIAEIEAKKEAASGVTQ